MLLYSTLYCTRVLAQKEFKFIEEKFTIFAQYSTVLFTDFFLSNNNIIIQKSIHDKAPVSSTVFENKKHQISL